MAAGWFPMPAAWACSISVFNEEEIERDVAKVRSLTDEPFAVLMFPQKESILDAEKLRLQDTALSPLREDLGCTAARPISAPLFDNQFRKIVELKVPAVGLRLGGLREPYMEELEANGIFCLRHRV